MTRQGIQWAERMVVGVAALVLVLAPRGNPGIPSAAVHVAEPVPPAATEKVHAETDEAAKEDQSVCLLCPVSPARVPWGPPTGQSAPHPRVGLFTTAETD